MHPLLTPSSHADLEIAAKELVFAEYYVGDPNHCYLKMLLGTTLGLTIFESIHGITFEAGSDGKPGKVIVEPFALIERVIDRSVDYRVEVATSTEQVCDLNFFQNGKIKGQHKLTKTELEKKGLAITGTRLHDITYAQGVQKFFPHLFGHKFFLRAELPVTQQQQVKAIVEQSNNKVVTADQIATTRKPGTSALSLTAQKIVDWQKGYQQLSIEKPKEWDAHLAILNGFDFLNESQKDDLVDELLGHGINYGVEYDGDLRRFYLYKPQLA